MPSEARPKIHTIGVVFNTGLRARKSWRHYPIVEISSGRIEA